MTEAQYRRKQADALTRQQSKAWRAWMRAENRKLIATVGREPSVEMLLANVTGNAQQFYDAKKPYVTTYRAVVPVAARTTTDALRSRKATDDWLLFVLEWIEAMGGDLVTAVTGFSHATVVGIVRRVAAAAAEEGWAINRVAKELLTALDTIAEFRARRIARTEVMRAYSLGSREAAIRTNLVLDKQWLTANDGRGERHATELYPDLHEQIRGRDEYYNVGGYEALYPQDVALPPSESVNCRCTEIWIPR